MEPANLPVVLIPAYKPADALVQLVTALGALPLSAVVVVDDGSGHQFDGRFAAVSGRPRVSVLRHAVNLGKGAALKTGLNHILCEWPDVPGVVTADADGQHHPDDIRRVAEAVAARHGELVLGVRELGTGVPLRSRFGNGAMRLFFRIAAGHPVRDTQTGLRGIPMALVPELLRLRSSGYEFEMEMLLVSKQLPVPIREIEIRTIYLNDNASSHFHPFFDSMRIYFALLRFSARHLPRRRQPTGSSECRQDPLHREHRRVE